MNSVRSRYEQFPYPPIPTLALPKPGQGDRLSYDLGVRLAHEQGIELPRSQREIRILVAGAGTFEPLIVAERHPLAREVVAVDFSSHSIEILNRRIKLTQIKDKLALTRLRRRPPSRIRTVCADLHDWEDGEFDLILASNVLHHVPDPAALFKRLSGWLRPGGLLRVVTYPRQSRIWMRETARWLKINGVRAESPDARRHALHAISLLPEGHPVRNCFISQPETEKPAGLVDAFFHPCEVPLAPLEWASACAQTGLVFLGDHQVETSRSSFLTELLPQTAALTSWERLQILDDLLEVCANPILWFVKPLNEGPKNLEANSALFTSNTAGDFNPVATESYRIPSRIHFELAQGLRRASHLLSTVGVSLHDAVKVLHEQVGPRVTPPPRKHELKGLSITEYNIDELLALPTPWCPPDLDLERLQIQEGATQSWITPRSS